MTAYEFKKKVENASKYGIDRFYGFDKIEENVFSFHCDSYDFEWSPAVHRIVMQAQTVSKAWDCVEDSTGYRFRFYV